MALVLENFEQKAREAIQAFWGNREAARKNQINSGKADQGERAGVTAGKNMDGFIALIVGIVKDNGLPGAEIHRDSTVLTLPGFFRPTKRWDLLVIQDHQLIAAIELKSQVGPSFGNNFNNRTEETIGTAHDFWTAYREGAFGDHPRPFLGWVMLVEDAPKSRKEVKVDSPHFEVFSEFKGASYVKRYDLLCQKLVKEGLYTTASLIASPREACQACHSGDSCAISNMTSLKTFVTSLAGHIAAEAARINE
ncbi:MAG: PaeR7I family type II restriction endonuclease [Lentisphaeria bacterium]|nr:PaeR7I family type II restriction endonuclease [Lentisphaeria bacterium]